MIRLTCQRHTDQIWKESEVTQYSSGNDGWNSTPKRWGCWDIFYLKDISDIRSIISIRSMFYRAKALWEVLEQNKENFNPGSFIIKISRCTLLSFLCGMLGFEMEDGSPPEASLNSHQEAKELIFGDDSCKYQLQEFLKSDRNEMTILLCGKTGVGKSHLTNALIGKNLTKEDHTLFTETTGVSRFTTI